MQKPHTCQCPNCLAAGYHPDKVLHHRLNLLLSRLDEQQRRWLTALESMKIGHGGGRPGSTITGLNGETNPRGRPGLVGDLKDCPPGRLRPGGACRPAL